MKARLDRLRAIGREIESLASQAYFSWESGTDPADKLAKIDEFADEVKTIIAQGTSDESPAKFDAALGCRVVGKKRGKGKGRSVSSKMRR